ncbi:type III polyketide synthase [Cyanobium sp. NIES-981]|uniref:type III polyketide synthase n=1 Tax=Cyanobium sp. NIES-981 TaxID=1851505 RepID=UPI0007DD7F0A|nr:type III polyketide synthase [Cyanobium sp. NIES-981]SBO42063.1 Phloroisovalerophenone synthase [Cyanobium sp. NIES-981]
MGLILRGIGTAVPERRLSQEQALALAPQMVAATARQQRLLRRIYLRSGVDGRHCVPLLNAPNPSTAERMRHYRSEAVPLALQACRRALEDAAMEPEAITHLVTVSCTGFSAPGVDLALIAAVPLRPDVARTHVGFMGCHGALNGLRVARAFVEADPRACVLLCAVELCSLHLQEGWHPDHIVANALFADGAAAVVVAAQAEPGSEPEPGRPCLRLRACGSTVIPASSDAMAWIIENHGFSMALSARVPGLIAARLRPWLEGWLAAHGLSVAAIRHWAVHPGGPRILGAVLESVGLDPGRLDGSREVLRRYGNMSSATVLFILQRLLATPPAAGHAGEEPASGLLGAPRAGAASGPCLALGFGPGLTVEAVLFELP